MTLSVVVIKSERFFSYFSAIVISLLIPDINFGPYKLPVRIKVSKLATDHTIDEYILDDP